MWMLSSSLFLVAFPRTISKLLRFNSSLISVIQLRDHTLSTIYRSSSLTALAIQLTRSLDKIHLLRISAQPTVRLAQAPCPAAIPVTITLSWRPASTCSIIPVLKTVVLDTSKTAVMFVTSALNLASNAELLRLLAPFVIHFWKSHTQTLAP